MNQERDIISFLKQEKDDCIGTKSPIARMTNDVMIKNKGILLKLVKSIILPTIGGSIRGKYNAIVIPMNPIAIV